MLNFMEHLLVMTQVVTSGTLTSWEFAGNVRHPRASALGVCPAVPQQHVEGEQEGRREYQADEDGGAPGPVVV
jgi:hypothetical protein